MESSSNNHPLSELKEIFNILKSTDTLAMLGLSALRMDIFQMRYNEEKSFADIGTLLKISSDDVCKIHSETIKQIALNLKQILDSHAESKSLISVIDRLKAENTIYRNQFNKLKKADKKIVGDIDFLKSSLEVLNLDTRCWNALMAYDVRTISDLVALTEDQLLRFRNLGPNSVNLIKDILQKFNLSLATVNTNEHSSNSEF